MQWPKKVLMIQPLGFKVAYAINPHMLDSQGQLNQVDEKKAFEQWEALKNLFMSLGLEVEVLSGDPELPDMVFCANQTFPYLNEAGDPCWVLSRMASPQRQNEVDHLEDWLKASRRHFDRMTDFDFEGCGDAIWDYEGERLFLGHGYRTKADVRPWLSRLIHLPVISLELVSEHFYHLDTCFFVLNQKTCAYVKEAFSSESLQLIQQSFSNCVQIDFEEARWNFAGNAFCPNGKQVVLQKGSKILVQTLRAQGFEPIEVETGEFMKSGGSVFCMKQAFWN